MNFDKRILPLIAIILIIVFFAGVKFSDMKQLRLMEAESLQLSIDKEYQDSFFEKDQQEEEEVEIIVYITGAVRNPGVYSFTLGARMYEALELACPLETADLNYVEMARYIVDEETIYIPAVGETEIPQEFQFALRSGSDRSGKININRATADEIAGLNGIGPVLAERIIDYRNENGSFNNIEDIKKVSGIGDKRFADIKDSIVVR